MRKSQAPSKRLSNASGAPFGSPLNQPTGGKKETGRCTNAILGLLQKKSIDVPKARECVQLDSQDADKLEKDARFFSVVYGKPSKKKHKTWEGDGTLKVTEKSAVLKDENGSIVGQTTKLPCCELSAGAQLFVGGKEVEIISETSNSEDFNKKRKHSENEVEAKSFRSKKKKISAISSPFTASFSSFKPALTKDDFVPLIMPKPDDQHQWRYNSNHLPVTEVAVDPCLCRVLRQHQREGLVFLYRCVTGIRSPDWTGAILADEMGLGKTIQCIALIWTLLNQGPYGNAPILSKILIVVPSSLVQNWNNEFVRWLGSHRIRVFAITKKHKPKDFKKYHQIPVMIISYEMLVRCFEDVKDIKFDLMICDEGHRLKNSNIRTSSLLSEIKCKRRVLLTGTPVQNDLQEFYSLVDFINPGILGTASEFRSKFETSILASREPNAYDEVVEEGEKKAEELNRITNCFILRRTQSVIGNFLPKKHEYVLFCEPSNLQKLVYSSATDYWNERENGAEPVSHLSVITALKKICNHPILVQTSTDSEEEDLSGTLNRDLSGYSFRPEDSGKLNVTCKLLENLKGSKEKIVFVSNFTQTLDLMERVCKTKDYNFLRFDGSTNLSQRGSVVDSFNSPESKVFVLLLSSKAGGVGLNLIGGSRLILFDSDWNPATDLQAMSRIWREGQKKNVHIYRLLSSGTLEEKIFQRQLTKAGLSESVVDTSSASSIKLSKEEIKDLFTFSGTDKCLTHVILKCPCAGDGAIEAIDSPQETDDHSQLLAPNGPKAGLRMNQLFQWEHHESPIDPEIIADMKLKGSEESINFVFKNSA